MHTLAIAETELGVQSSLVPDIVVAQVQIFPRQEQVVDEEEIGHENPRAAVHPHQIVHRGEYWALERLPQLSASHGVSAEEVAPAPRV